MEEGERKGRVKREKGERKGGKNERSWERKKRKKKEKDGGREKENRGKEKEKGREGKKWEATVHISGYAIVWFTTIICRCSVSVCAAVMCRDERQAGRTDDQKTT